MDNSEFTPPQEPKAGWKSSEWWTTMVAKILSLLVAVDVVGSSDADAYTKGISGVVGGIFIIATTWLAHKYGMRRTLLKDPTRGPGPLSMILLTCLALFCLDSVVCAQGVRLPQQKGTSIHQCDAQLGLINLGCRPNQPQQQYQPPPAPPQVNVQPDPAIGQAMQQMANAHATLAAALAAQGQQKQNSGCQCGNGCPCQRGGNNSAGQQQAPQVYMIAPGYNPTPINPGYNPSPINPGYNPAPINPGYAPTPIQIHVHPTPPATTPPAASAAPQVNPTPTPPSPGFNPGGPAPGFNPSPVTPKTMAQPATGFQRYTTIYRK